MFSILGVRILTLCDGCSDDERSREAQEERDRRVYELTNVKDAPRDREWSFETYPKDALAQEVRGQAEAWTAAWLAAHEPYEEYDARGEALPPPLRPPSPGDLLMHGPVGTGKSGLAWCIVRELILAGHRVQLVNWRNLLYDIREGFGPVATRESLDRYIGVPVLFLDDVGAERPTEWAAEQLATLIDARYMKGRTTGVTSNYSPNDLIDRLSPPGAGNEVVGQRIVSRMREGATVIKFEGKDRRLSA